MTLEELELIKDRLECVAGCLNEEQRKTCKSCAATKKAKEIIDREIKLKTLDPRKEN